MPIMERSDSFMKNMNNNSIKILGWIATLAGFGASMLCSYVNDKKIENTIEEKVQESLAEKSANEES